MNKRGKYRKERGKTKGETEKTRENKHPAVVI